MAARQSTQRIFQGLGTVHSITLFEKDSTNVLDEIREMILGAEKRWSIFRDDSEISALNRTAGLGSVSVSSDTFDILTQAQRYHELSGGAFDITLAKVTQLWKASLKSGTLPSDQEIRDLRTGVDGGINLDPVSNLVSLPSANQAIDLGGIAKGYLADQIRTLFHQRGVRNALANLGGTVLTIGEPRAIGIQNPYKAAGKHLGSLMVENRAVVTSGTNEQAAYVGGRMVHHLIDPRTGYPAESEIRSVLLVGDCAAELDAFATAILVLGLENGMKLVQKRGLDAVIVLNQGEILITPNLQGAIRLDSDSK